MDFFETVRKRKSVRSYQRGKTIPEKDINTILETVSFAPSAKNLQGYKIFLAEGEHSVRKLVPVFFNQRGDIIKNAAAIFVFCSDPGRSLETFGQRGNFYSIQDATIAASIAILAAVSMGYATCWVGNFRDEEMKKALDTSLLPVVSVIIGYGDEDPVRPERKDLRDLVIRI